jgi:hypothetical protein
MPERPVMPLSASLVGWREPDGRLYSESVDDDDQREEGRRRFVGSPLQLILLVGCLVAFVLPVGRPLLQVIAGIAMFGLVLIPAAYGVIKAFDVQDPSQQ